MTVRFAICYVVVIVPMMIIMFRMITTTNNNDNDNNNNNQNERTNEIVNYNNSVASTTASTSTLARILGCRFRQHINENRTFGNSATITNEGRLRRDRDTPIWSMFSDAFGANPNTPYLYATLPMISFDDYPSSWLRLWSWFEERFLTLPDRHQHPTSSSSSTSSPLISLFPSPMWRLRNTNDVVVLIGQIPPTAEYYSFTTFALWRPYSFIFASLGDSANTFNLKYDHDTGLFAYIVCFAEMKKKHDVDMHLIVDDGVNGSSSSSSSSRRNDDKKSAYEIVMRSLVASGLSKDAINVLVLPPQPTIDNNNNNNTTTASSRSPWTYYELVLRIFRFRNQTEGEIYLQCHDQPFYYVSANNSNLLLTTTTSTTTNTKSYDTATCSSDDVITTSTCKRTDDTNNDDDNNNNNNSNNNDNVDVNKNTQTIPTNPHQWWLPPSNPTGFKSRSHPKNIWEKEENLTSSFIQYGYDVITDLHRIFQKITKIDDEETNNEVKRNDMDMNLFNYTNHSFGPLFIAAGTECLRDNIECLGGCPDAAYFGLNVAAKQQEDDGDGNHSSASSHNFETLAAWLTLNELHVVTMVNHRVLNASIYGSVALLTSRSRHVDPKHMTRNIRATSVGVTSYDFLDDSEHDDDDGLSSSLFVTWVFTRNPNHCRVIKQQQQQQQQQHPQQLPSRRRLFGCTVINKRHISSSRYVTYCERIYLNPLTGTGPDYDSILPARLFRLFLKDGDKHNRLEKRRDELHKEEKISLLDDIPGNNLDIPFSNIRLPPSRDVITLDGKAPLRFLHIIKTGGESLENYLWQEQSPRIDYSACRAAALKGTNSSSKNTMMTAANTLSRTRGSVCDKLAIFTSSALCGLNCECCALDMLESTSSRGDGSGGDRRPYFHGTLLRSPRAHVLSQFSHCHAAHHSDWLRIFGDVPLYAAELLLRLTEQACQSSCDVDSDANWYQALEKRLVTDENIAIPSHSLNGDHTDDRVLVISIHNTQSHALICRKSKGSFGHHFRRINAENIDTYTPSLREALETLDRFEWFGITELFMPSLCLLHYQWNKTLPSKCDCDSPNFVEHDKPGALGYWKETRSKKRIASQLSPKMLEQIDYHTTVDSMLYATAIRIFLGRLRRVEELTGTSILKCIQWGKFYTATDYMSNLWTGPNGLLI